MHVSPRTVTSAYNRLIAENRAHKVGKRVLAGGPIKNLPGIGSGVVIILTLRIYTWASICSQKRTADFGTVFQRLADQHGVRIIQAGIEKTPTDPTGLYPHGPYELGRLLHRLGDRYLGTILAVTRTELPDIQEWIDLLSVHGKPIVWFDRHDDGTEGLRTNDQIYRCRYSEEVVVRRALEYLADLGHKKVGYATVRDDEPEWSRNRYRLLRELSETEPNFPEITAYEFLLKGEWWTEKTKAEDRLNELYMMNRLPLLREAFDLFRDNSKKIVEDLGHLVDERFPYEGDFDGLILFSRLFLTHKLDAEAYSADLFRAAGVIWPSFQLLPVLEDPATTALILPNDAHASPYVRWFRRVGVQIPHNLTLLSFDNEKYKVPVTSVDFGFGYLGHQAFLAVLGQNSVRCDKHGTIDPVATVVEKGSF
jgi:DNA-binding LacI/PurR family transcriptional regulator